MGDKGEILVRGPNVMKGYFKNEAKTKETIDEDGWLHTGDVGMWTSTGTLRIIDRKKHIFKLSQGEYIAPEKIENVYLTTGCVQQIFVHGDSLKSNLVGIVVPDSESFSQWCAIHVGTEPEADFADLCDNDKVNAKVLEVLTETGRNNKLKGFEQVKRIFLETKPFTTEAGLLTATLKSRRPQLKEH